MIENVNCIVAQFKGEFPIDDNDFSQTQFEILLVDGGSTDKTMSIIDKFQTEFKLFYENKDLRTCKKCGTVMDPPPVIS